VQYRVIFGVLHFRFTVPRLIFAIIATAGRHSVYAPHKRIAFDNQATNL
jgi:hypothetical protein